MATYAFQVNAKYDEMWSLLTKKEGHKCYGKKECAYWLEFNFEDDPA